MRIFAISDLHLSFAIPKPMEKFGDNWKGHFKKIRDNWQDIVHESDVVLIPGDISWALKYRDALQDIRFISDLPGRKIIIKGNHDYWWTGIKRLRTDAPEDIYFIQNDVRELEDIVISGVRLWKYPFIKWPSYRNGFDVEKGTMNKLEDRKYEFDNEKIRNREIERLKLCLSKMQDSSGHFRVFMTHFPPVGPDMKCNMITTFLSENKVDMCIFGHLHDVPKEKPIDTKINGVKYVFVSCDYLDFKPKLILEL